MHEAVCVVIPGAINKLQVQINAKSSECDDISSILPEINSIYDASS